MSTINPQKNINKPALGKGLASLLPGAAQVNSAIVARQILGDVPPPAATQLAAQTPAAASAAAPVTTEPPIMNKDRIPGVSVVEIDAIVPNQYQPRRDFSDESLAELSESIKSNGVIQPLIVRRSDDGKYHLIAGERRLRASKLAGLKQVPVVVRKSTDKEALEIALIENIQREDLNCIDVALSYFQLIEDFHLTQEEAAKRVGKDRASVANHLRLLKLPEAIIQDLRDNKLTYGHGRALLSLTDPLKRIEIRNLIVEKQLSVRETERLVAEALTATGEKKEKPAKAANPELKNFSDRLARALGTKVKTKGDQYRGSIVIEYFSKEDLERIGDQLLR